jgi:hypothetical protein
MFARSKKPHVPVRARAQAQAQSQVQDQAQAQAKVHARPKSKPTVDVDHVNWLLLRWLINSSLPPSILEDNMLIGSCKPEHICKALAKRKGSRSYARSIQKYEGGCQSIRAVYQFSSFCYSGFLDFS